MAKIAYVILRRSLVQQAQCSVEVPNNTTPEQAYEIAQKRFTSKKNKDMQYINWRTDEVQILPPLNTETDIIFGESDDEEAMVVEDEEEATE